MLKRVGPVGGLRATEHWRYCGILCEGVVLCQCNGGFSCSCRCSCGGAVIGADDSVVQMLSVNVVLRGISERYKWETVGKSGEVWRGEPLSV
jgi:hypothetical protein